MSQLAPQYIEKKNLKTPEQTKRWLAANYSKLEDGGFHYLGGEPNTQNPEEFEGADLRILILRLSTYDAVDGSMAHSLLSQIARETGNKIGAKVFCDFAFLPPRKDYDLFDEVNIPVILPVITKRQPADFDMIFVSHAVCLERINWPRMAIKSGLPLFKKERMETPGIPLIFMGGAHAFADEDMHGFFDEDQEHYGLVDACILGDGEAAIPKMVKLWMQEKTDSVGEGRMFGFTKDKEGKEKFLYTCHTRFVPGMYEPDKYDHTYENGKLVDIRPNVGYVEFPVKKAKVLNLDTVRTLEERVLWYGVALGGTADVEIARGCGAHCSFCQEASVARPYRERSLDEVTKASWASRYFQGATEVNLFSFVWNQYSDIYPLLTWLLKKFGLCNLISNRLDMQAEDRLLARMMKQMGTAHTTVGLEGCSERLRHYLHKNLSHQQVLDGCRHIFEGGISELKLFMIATGREEQEDIDEFRSLLRDLIAIRNSVGSTAQIRCSFTPLFHCAKTALQWGACESVNKINERTLDAVVQECKALGIGFRTSAKRSEIVMAQLLEMADRRLAPLTIKSSIDDGYIYYGFVAKDEQAKWDTRMKEYGLDPEYYFGEKPKDYVFPWDHISTGLSNAYLYKLYTEVKEFQEREYCVGTLSKRGTCTSCAACETPAQIAALTARTMSTPVDANTIQLEVRPLLKVNQIRFKVAVEPMYRTVPKRFYALDLGRALVQATGMEDKPTPDFIKEAGLTGFFMEHYNKVMSNSRTPAAANQQKDWTCGEVLMDVAVDAPISEAIVKKLIPVMNEKIKGWKILDARVMREMESLNSACEIAVYEIMLPAADFSFLDLTTKVDKYFASTNVKFRKRVAAGKNVFKTEIVDLDKTQIVGVNAFFTGESHNRVVWSCNAKLNPYETLVALLGGRSFQYRKFPVNCLGYYKAGKKGGADDIFAVLSGGSALCTECQGTIETDTFTGKPYEPTYGKKICVACDIARQDAKKVSTQLAEAQGV